MSPRPFIASLSVLSLIAAAPTLAQDADATVDADDAAVTEATEETPFVFAEIAPQMAGEWDGALTYRDYQSGERETIPMRAVVTVAPDASYSASAVAFTDPGFKVYTHDVTQPIGRQGVRVTQFRDGQMTVGIRRLTEFALNETGWTATFEERGRDDDQAAILRYTETLADDIYVIRKDVKPLGADAFSFRNEITLAKAGD